MRLSPDLEDGFEGGGEIRAPGRVQCPADPGSSAPQSFLGRRRASREDGSAAGTRKMRTPLSTGARHPVAGRRPRVKSWGVGARAGGGGRAGSPGPGGVPGRRQARRWLEAEGLANPCLGSSESDRRLRLSVRVPAGAGDSKWQKEAERLGPATLASAPFGLRGAPN